MSADEGFMRRALEVARLGLGRTHPNPSVGCVIVHRGEVVASGFTSPPGGPHAEVHALRALEATGLPASECVAYVTLEPCCTFGRTPPCTRALISAGIPEVVVGTIDPHHKVDGAGIAQLRAAGVTVRLGVLEDECAELIVGFAKHVRHGLPWVRAKWAMSLDGKIASATGDSVWISGEASRARVHRWRDTHDAIMVGKGTLLADDPSLTCRGVDGGRDPIRVVVDARLDAPTTAKVFSEELLARAPTWVCVGEGAGGEKRAALEARGVGFIEAPADARGWLDMGAVMRGVAARGVTTVLAEGGGGLLGSLMDLGLVDRVSVFVAPLVLGGEGAPGPMGGVGFASPRHAPRLERRRVEAIGEDVLVEGDVPESHRSSPG
jgi:diaminohydroxyphosphoribosylaminopyrimidine deaminase/5-amino-6-(5-phosphoribosylamino)uracil reductase